MKRLFHFLLGSLLRHAFRGPGLALALGLIGADANALCTVVCSCNVSTTSVAFGSFNPLSMANTDSTGTVKVSCGGVVGLAIPYQVDLGKGATGSYAARRMTSGGNPITYNLFIDNSRSQVWGDGTGGTQTVTGNIGLDVAGTSPPVTYTVYGRIPGSQTTAVPGLYGDSVSVTLTYF